MFKTIMIKRQNRMLYAFLAVIISLCINSCVSKKINPINDQELITLYFPENTIYPTIEPFPDDVPGEFIIIKNNPAFFDCKSKVVNRTHKNLSDCHKVEFLAFFKANMRYPRAARKANISGVVNIFFVVNKESEITNIKAVGHSYLLEEAIRLIRLLPKPEPAKMRGRPITQELHYDIEFIL